MRAWLWEGLRLSVGAATRRGRGRRANPAMAVHFKFRSAVAYDSISLDDLHISVRNLKQRIVEHKNLASNRTIDFDLVITDSQTGEEYRDENSLVPRNTSVIIKRVPAVRSKQVLQAFDPPKVPPNSSATAPVARPPVKSDVEPDDFGMDLFATPAPVPAAKVEEDAKIVEMVSKSTLEWQRFENPSFVPRGGGKGRGRGSGGPPAGYVCHRCGQPGHFIQQCPTNGDPNYDIKKVRLPVGIPRTRLRLDQEGSYVLPDGSVAMMQPDENLFAKEANALLSVKPTTEAPSELRCPLCRSTFKDAVMIPCCQYSFCDKCIRQNLMLKGQCPQCGSARFKNDDLLPNIALRQAIDKFMQSQTLSTTGDQGVAIPDGDSTAQHVISLSESKHSADDNVEAGKAREASSGVVNAESSVANKTDANSHPVIPKDASGSLNPEGNEALRDLGDGGKTSEPFVHKGADEIALESEVSKGKKKKKRARGMNSVDGGGADASGKGERFCYQCGEAGHLAKDCVENAGAYPPHPGMFPPGGAFPMGPYGPDMFWPGPPVPPFLPGYADGMYGPGLGPVPPPGAYQIPPCVPPPYASIPPMHWFGDHPGMMGGDMPLSREDFMKLKEEEHNRRSRNDHRGDWSQSSTRGRSPPQDSRRGRSPPKDSRHGRPSESRDRRNGSVERHHKKPEADYDSTRNYSDRERSDRERTSAKQYNKERDYESARRYADEQHHKEERRSKFSSKPEEAPPPASSRRSQEKDSKRSDQPHTSRSSESARNKQHEKTSKPPSEKTSESSRSKHHSEREAEITSTDEKRKEESRKRRNRSREIEEEKTRSSYDDKKPREDRSSRSYLPSRDHHSEDHHSRQLESSRSSRHHHSEASDDLARWRPDHYEEDRYRHTSSSGRHHHRR
ncbi:E3 ubiquitin ligase PARAQUAT TOLERANCE 3 [Selaginella moellendorffii]|uniref:E3 ubiquitin ligase PARAQUAT TOLERANCE 3 n=1 Tax=Selaginella moellendorffii TaxID=88036 RepID=UPI000D1CBF57|nr:E3 ubiquitin ligase PARAQUAT TOLERANCE 3 [Selaginella moellendorffii]|eukprot:XP_024544726.1 E3 ubiquitin ligase PARAQUAT TOLERANCE 3 [Selaginella moellendorffii]